MNKKLQTIIIDDEPLAREGILMYTRDIDFIELKAVCQNALEANQALSSSPIDLMFLDIQMPKITGIEFLKSLKEPPLVILTTAYPNFALQGFELDVIDYLVKPYPFDRFLKAVNKARDFFELKNKPQSQSSGHQEDFFFVKVDYRFEKIHYRDILYVEGMENYVVIHTQDQKYITLLRMKALEETLPPADFLRIHKSYIAHIPSISAIDGNEIIVAGKRLPLSRERKNEILERLLKT